MDSATLCRSRAVSSEMVSCAAGGGRVLSGGLTLMRTLCMAASGSVSLNLASISGILKRSLAAQAALSV